VSAARGVIPRAEVTDAAPRADDLRIYKRVASGEIVINRMSAHQGALGLASEPGVVSPDYLVLRVGSHADPRWLRYMFRSTWFVSQMAARVRGIGSVDQGNVRTPRINWDELGQIPIQLPELAQQHAIADYLDAETARIDAVVERRERQAARLRERFESLVWGLVTGSSGKHNLRQSGLAWVPHIPRAWGTPPVGARFEVQLGKMLNPEAKSAGEPYPYLRNVNVQWDRIDVSDLEAMHFDAADRERYALRDGDLLVCEGGEVGRAAIWHGEAPACFYQKALHRVRPYGTDSTRFLMYALRAAAGRGVFENEGNTSTIVHLTAEKLRAHRFPWPSADEQDAIVRVLDREKLAVDEVTRALERQLESLQERRQALITAAVTGQLEIPGVAA
jgi:type I restriction enzyme S subunit